MNASQIRRLVKLFALNSLGLLALSGCSTTDRLITGAIEQIKDLDYFLGNKELKSDEVEIVDGSTVANGYQQTAVNMFPDATPQSDLSRACLNIPDPRFSYKKKVAILGFDIENPHQVVDLGSIHREIPRDLAQRINRSSFVVVDASHEKSPNINTHVDIDIPSYIRHIAKKHNSQFVVSGVINDAGHVEANKTLLGKIKSAIPGKKLEKQRALAMTVTIFDGATGAIVDESHYQGGAKDQLSMIAKKPVFSNDNKEGFYAHLLDNYLSHQSTWVADTLTCLPMQASVTSVSGSAITFATGTESLIVPGDTLKLLRRIQLQHTLDGEPRYRYEENGNVVITQVYPNGALARFSGGSPPYQVNQGDIVQAW